VIFGVLIRVIPQVPRRRGPRSSPWFPPQPPGRRRPYPSHGRCLVPPPAGTVRQLHPRPPRKV